MVQFFSESLSRQASPHSDFSRFRKNKLLQSFGCFRVGLFHQVPIGIECHLDRYVTQLTLDSLWVFACLDAKSSIGVLTEDPEYRRKALTKIGLKRMLWLARFAVKESVQQRAAHDLMQAAGLLDRKTDKTNEETIAQFDLVRLVRERAEKKRNEKGQEIESRTKETLELSSSLGEAPPWKNPPSKWHNPEVPREKSKYAGLTIPSKKPSVSCSPEHSEGQCESPSL